MNSDSGVSSTLNMISCIWSPFSLISSNLKLPILGLLLIHFASVDSQAFNQSTTGSTRGMALISTTIFSNSPSISSDRSSSSSSSRSSNFPSSASDGSTIFTTNIPSSMPKSDFSASTALFSNISSSEIKSTTTVGLNASYGPFSSVVSGVEGGVDANATSYTTSSVFNVTSAVLNVTSTGVNSNYTSDNGGLSAEAIVGITVGCAVYVVAMIVVIYVICLCTRRRSMISSARLPELPDSDWADHRGYRRYGTGGAGMRRKHPAVSGERYRQSVDDALYPSRSSLNSESSGDRVRPANKKKAGVDQVRSTSPIRYQGGRTQIGDNPRYAWDNNLDREDSFRY